MKEILCKNVNELIRDKKIKSTLDEIGISNIGELCNFSRMELNEKGFSTMIFLPYLTASLAQYS